MTLFQKGNNEQAKRKTRSGGRLPRPKEARYLSLLLEIVTEDEWKKVVLTALARARAGDSVARSWLSDWILGKPIERHEHSGPDGEPVAVIIHSEGISTLDG